ncbi:ParBc domain-containing protein [Cephalotus follicularis]|uniref:Sulfiredoxin n=1 Tax=Cephalotus follicularis TaxID=3775 RepID=A0A1Q3C2H3_CEPFO|nr:ParBc domain-containing protein [Cephalotus follicularis]
MANFILQVPNNLRSFSVYASSNGAPPNIIASQSDGGRGPLILELPVDKIRRPLMRTRANDPHKVKELMDSIQQIGLQVPIDVLEVDGVYYGFSGCHRYEAHQRLGLPTIRCKVRRGTKETLSFGDTLLIVGFYSKLMRLNMYGESLVHV